MKKRKNIINSLKEGVDGNGAYILKDHGYKGGLLSTKSVDLVVGRVTDSYGDEGNNIFYKGRIEDEDIAKKIKSKLLTASSIGLHIGNMLCSICGEEYGSVKCNHKLGVVYEKSKILPYIAPYLTQNKATIYARNVRALEQSIV